MPDMPRHRLFFGLLCAFVMAACATVPCVRTARAEADRPVPAATVVVRLPITGTRDTQVKAAILRQLDGLRSQGSRRGVLVLEFRPTDDDGALPTEVGRWHSSRREFAAMRCSPPWHARRS